MSDKMPTTYDEFRAVLKAYVQSNNMHRQKLAEIFEVALSTVDRWWLGTAKPHPKLQLQVMEWIKEQDK